MVAFAKDYAPEIEAPDAENRVWDFFSTTPETRRSDRRSARHPRREKPDTFTKTASGVHYYGFRFYSPSQGRFLNKDPIEEAGGLNLYAFVGNDPVNRWDYLGLALTEFTGPVPTRLITDPNDPSLVGRDGDAWITSSWDRPVAFVRSEFFTWVEIKGELTLEIFFRPGERPSDPGLPPGTTLLDHELQHAEIHMRWWSNSKREVDPFEGVYCPIECNDIAAKWANAVHDKNYWSQRRENLILDWDVYLRDWSEFSPRRRDHQISIATAHRNINEARRRAQNATAEYISAGCSKMGSQVSP